MILHSFTNTESNTTAFVNTHSLGFSVTMRDNDCDMYIPCAIIYPTEVAAIAKAKKIAGVAS